MHKMSVNQLISQSLKGLLLVSLLASVSMAQAATSRSLFLASSPGGLPLPFPESTTTTSNIVFDDVAFTSGVAGSIIADSFYIDFDDGYGPAAPGEFIDESFGAAVINHNGNGGILSLDLTVAIDATTLINVEIDPTSNTKEWFGHFELTDVAEVPVPAAAWLFSSALLGMFGIRRQRQ